MNATLLHNLKSHVKGWSSFYVNPIDIRKVIDISYNKRLFCIFDSEYKYTLRIEYYNPRSEITTSPVFTSRGSGVAITESYKEISIMTIRYKTKNEINQEINEIYKLKNIIKNFDEEQNKKLKDFADGFK
jgi:hypothetical protein